MARLPGQSQVDWLWVNYGERPVVTEPTDDPLAIPSYELVKKIADDITSNGIGSIKQDGNALVLYSIQNKEMGRIDMKKLEGVNSITDFEKRVVLVEDKEAGCDLDLYTPVYVISLDNNTKLFAPVEAYVGGKNNLIKNTIDNLIIYSELLLSESEANGVKLIPEEDGLSGLVVLDGAETGITFSILSESTYLKLPEYEKNRVYFIKLRPYFYFNGFRIGNESELDVTLLINKSKEELIGLIDSEKERAIKAETKLETHVRNNTSSIKELTSSLLELDNNKLEKGNYAEFKESASEPGKYVMTLNNADLIMGKTNPNAELQPTNKASAVTIAQVNKWNVIDFGSPHILSNINTPDGVRPTVQEKSLSGEEAHKISYLEDVESLEKSLKEYFNILLKNYNIKSGDEIANIMKQGGDIVIVSNTKADKGYTLTKNTNIDLNSYTLDAESNGNYGDNMVIGNGANITISNGEIAPANKANLGDLSATIIVKTAYESHLTLNNTKVTGIYPIYLNSANESSSITINSGEYYSSYEMNPAVYVGKGSSSSTIGGKVTIYGGTFGLPGVTHPYLLNVEDILRKLEGKEPRNFIEVFGGKFYNFNPADNKAEGEGTNFVADGYTVEVTNDGEDTIYTVIPIS